ncbi:flavin-nucleotide-binding protein [Phlyctema vagabunda]|uniref:Flavin-nucleotide-binding protein n=1 Tax=Phlyctema vagabunda TaxID=108571 RepID=A0ABR4PDN0_9HELO
MAEEHLSSYPKNHRNTVNRYGKPRGRYDYETIHSIVNTVPVLHVSFSLGDDDDPFPAMIPMLGFMASFSSPSTTNLSEPLDLYLHGYISSRLMKLPSNHGNGLPLTVAATHLDGLVLALTPNHHSYNYRSAILHGFATPVQNEEEKLWAMERITNAVVNDRWNNTRVPPTKTEMISTQILKVRIVTASAKVRQGMPGDDRHDLKNEKLREKVWIGVVPTWTQYGEPVVSPENRVKAVPAHITDFVKTINQRERGDALAAAKSV